MGLIPTDVFEIARPEDAATNAARLERLWQVSIIIYIIIIIVVVVISIVIIIINIIIVVFVVVVIIFFITSYL